MVILVGLGGGTNSGKTTLCKRIVSEMPNLKIFVFNQDKYFKTLEEAQLSFPGVPVNWETCPALKMDLLVRDVIEKRDEGKYDVVIVEGHLVLTHQPLASLFHLTFYITLTYELALRRRLTRTYDPPDYPGYFETFVWPGYLNIVSGIRGNADLNPVWLDASDPEACFEALCEAVLLEIKKH